LADSESVVNSVDDVDVSNFGNDSEIVNLDNEKQDDEREIYEFEPIEFEKYVYDPEIERELELNRNYVVSDPILEIINQVQNQKFNELNQPPPVFSTFAYGEYPSKTWGFNYQENPADYNVSTFPSFVVKFGGFVRLYNKFIDHSAQRINELQAFVSSVDRKTTAISSNIASNEGSINVLTRRANSVDTIIKSNEGSINVLTRRANSVDTIIKSNEGSINVLTRRLNGVDSNISSFDGSINSLARRLNTVEPIVSSHDGSITVLTRRLNAVDSTIDSHDGSINVLTRRANSVDTLLKSYDGSINVLTRRLNALEPTVSSHDGSINVLTRRANSVDDSIKIERDRITATGDQLRELVKVVHSQGDQIVVERNRISNVSDRLTVLTTGVNLMSLNLDKQSKRIDDAESKSKNQDLVLTGLVASDLLTNNKISKIEERLDSMPNLFDFFGVDLSAMDGGNFNHAEGSFVKLFKRQNTRIINDISSAVKNQTKSLIESFEDVGYKLRYSIVEGFSENTKNLNLKFLELKNSMVNNTLLINNNLQTALTYLKIISEKNLSISFPPQTFEFDYLRLQKMFDGIKFGDITNAAGKNIWDFLSDLVKALTEVVTSLTSLASQILDMLLKLIIPEDPNFFSEKVKGTTSIFDKKFKIVLDLKDIFTNTMSSSKVKIPESFDFVFMGNTVQVPLDIVQYSADYVKLPLTGFVLFEIFVYCYRKVTSADGGVIE